MQKKLTKEEQKIGNIKKLNNLIMSAQKLKTYH